MSTKLFVMCVHMDNEWADPWPEVAVATVSPEMARLWLGRMDAAASMKEEDGSLYSIEYWSHVEWLEYEEQGELFLPDYDQPLVLNNRPRIFDESRLRVDMQIAHVLPDGVWWEAYMKHTNDRVTTDRLTRDHMQRVLAEV